MSRPEDNLSNHLENYFIRRQKLNTTTIMCHYEAVVFVPQLPRIPICGSVYACVEQIIFESISVTGKKQITFKTVF